MKSLFSSCVLYPLFLLILLSRFPGLDICFVVDLFLSYIFVLKKQILKHIAFEVN